MANSLIVIGILKKSEYPVHSAISSKKTPLPLGRFFESYVGFLVFITKNFLKLQQVFRLSYQINVMFGLSTQMHCKL